MNNLLPRPENRYHRRAMRRQRATRRRTRWSALDRKTVSRLAPLRLATAALSFTTAAWSAFALARLELDELWAYVGKKQKRVKRHGGAIVPPTRVTSTPTLRWPRPAASPSSPYRTGKRDGENYGPVYPATCASACLARPRFRPTACTPTSPRSATRSASASRTASYVGTYPSCALRGGP